MNSMQSSAVAPRVATLAFALAVTLAGEAAQATNGYFANGYSPEAKGMAGAGVALPAGTLGLAQNPALGNAVGNSAEFCLSGFAPDRSFTIAPGGPLTAGTQTSLNTFFPIPCAGVNFARTERLSYGVLLYGNGGMNTEYTVNPFAGLGAGSSPVGVNLEQVFLQANVAYELGDRVSIGVAPILAIQRFSATGLEAFAGFSSNPAAVTNNGDDWSSGVGAAVGLFVEASDSLSFGVSWRSRIDMSPFSSYAGLFAEGGDFDIPATATVAASFTPPSHPRLTLTAEYQHIWYGSIPAIANSGALLATPLGAANGPGFGWTDQDVFRLAGEYRQSERLTLRGGVSYATSVIPSQEVLLNVLAPATPQWHISVGMTYQINDRWNFTGAFTHVPSASISGANATPGLTQPVTLEMSQNELSLGFTYRW